MGSLIFLKGEFVTVRELKEELSYFKDDQHVVLFDDKDDESISTDICVSEYFGKCLIELKGE